VRDKVREKKRVDLAARRFFDTLVHRVSRKSEDRPLLAGRNTREVAAGADRGALSRLCEADITIDSGARRRT